MQASPSPAWRVGPSLQSVWTRLRHRSGQTVMFALVGAVIGYAATLPEWLEKIEAGGGANFWQRAPGNFCTALLGALIIAFTLRGLAVSGLASARRPWRFAVLVVVVSGMANVVAWYFTITVFGSRFPSIQELPLEKFLDTWMQVVLWSALLGWLYLLTLQHADDRDMLDGLLGKRVLLARQLAKSRLGAARAQIDPAMVASTLGVVRERYCRGQQADAAALLDHLIDYLRLAMNRGQQALPQSNVELALMRAYIALREVEHGVQVGFQVQAGVSAAPHFLVVKTLLDRAISSGARTMQLSVEGQQVTLMLRNAIIDGEAYSAMREALVAVAPCHLAMNNESGKNTYVVNC